MVVGSRDMLPERVRAAAEKAENLTKHHERCGTVHCLWQLTHIGCSAVFNLCMPYTSRDEMATAVQSAIQERIDTDSESPYVLCMSLKYCLNAVYRITTDDVEAHLMTTLSGSPPLDVLVRTSGVKRLSDYMLWQVRGSFSQFQSSIVDP